MFLAIKRFSNIRNPDMVTKKIEAELVPKIKDLPGFIAYYAVKFDNGEHGPLVIFEKKTDLDNALEEGRKWLQQNLPDSFPTEPEILRGEVLFSATGKSVARSA